MAHTPVTVAVVSYQTRDLLGGCLASLRRDAEAGLASVWVVDNGSSDGSAELVEERFGWARLLRAERNLGFGSAVNRVAVRTRSPWLVAANADVAVRPNALDRLLAAGHADPQAGALSPRLLLPDGSTQHSVHAFPSPALALAAALPTQRLAPRLARRLCLPGAWEPDAGRRVPWAIGAFLLLRRAAFEAAGGFDEHQWLYAEDLDLGWRLRAAGWATRYVPDAHVEHAESAATAARWGEARAARWQAATYEWMLRRRGPALTRTTALIHATDAALRAAAPGRDPGSRRALRWWAAVHRSTGLARRRRRG